MISEFLFCGPIHVTSLSVYKIGDCPGSQLPGPKYTAQQAILVRAEVLFDGGDGVSCLVSRQLLLPLLVGSFLIKHLTIHVSLPSNM